MKPPGPAVLALVLAGCAAGGGGADLTGCREAAAESIDASLHFGDTAFEPAWQRRCDEGRTRVFKAVNAGAGAEVKRLVTLTRYPAEAEAERALHAYIARSRRTRVGEPRIFERRNNGDRTRYFAELVLRRGDARDLEYVLHGVTTGEAGRVISVTYTHRFPTTDRTALEAVKQDQGEWVREIERLLAGFPPP